MNSYVLTHHPRSILLFINCYPLTIILQLAFFLPLSPFFHTQLNRRNITSRPFARLPSGGLCQLPAPSTLSESGGRVCATAGLSTHKPSRKRRVSALIFRRLSVRPALNIRPINHFTCTVTVTGSDTFPSESVVVSVTACSPFALTSYLDAFRFLNSVSYPSLSS